MHYVAATLVQCTSCEPAIVPFGQSIGYTCQWLQAKHAPYAWMVDPWCASLLLGGTATGVGCKFSPCLLTFNRAWQRPHSIIIGYMLRTLHNGKWGEKNYFLTFQKLIYYNFFVCTEWKKKIKNRMGWQNGTRIQKIEFQ